MLESGTYNLNNDFIDPSILFLDKDLVEDELYYFNARYYDATTGRFINVDPIQDGTNWYIYCNNNPLNMIDLTGLSGKNIFQKAGDFLTHLGKIIVPTYGNYAGPGWTGGKRLWNSEAEGGKEPAIDNLDKLAKAHDTEYGEAGKDKSKIQASDLKLIEGAKALPQDASEWCDSSVDSKVAGAYRDLLISSFEVKSGTGDSHVGNVLADFGRYLGAKIGSIFKREDKIEESSLTSESKSNSNENKESK